jgi:hypothetical protein
LEDAVSKTRLARTHLLDPNNLKLPIGLIKPGLISREDVALQKLPDSFADSHVYLSSKHLAESSNEIRSHGPNVPKT